MHSSRMRTACLLPVSPSMHCAGGVYSGGCLPLVWGGVCSCLVFDFCCSISNSLLIIVCLNYNIGIMLEISKYITQPLRHFLCILKGFHSFLKDFYLVTQLVHNDLITRHILLMLRLILNDFVFKVS